MKHHEKHNLENALSGAEKLRQKTESGETILYKETEKLVEKGKLERGLTPEIIENVMSRVQDINKNGTAYTGVVRDQGGKIKSEEQRLGEFQHVLQEGLLGSPDYNPYGVEKDRWVHNMKNLEKRKELVVHFNIVGRTQDHIPENSTQILETLFMNGPNCIGIIFDDQSFKEVKLEKEPFKNKGGKTKYAIWGEEDEQGRRMPSLEMGFVLSHRVAPRFFRGIVFGEPAGPVNPEETKKGPWRIPKDTRPEAIAKRAEEIIFAILNAYKDKPELLIPVYDIYGNLWWPKKMKYEEIKKLVAIQEHK